MHDAAIVHLLSVGSCPGVAAGLALLAAAAVCHCIVLCSLVLWSWRHSILGAEAKSSDPLHLLAGALPAALPDPDSLDALSGMSAAASSVQNHSWRTPAQQQYAEWAVYAGGSLQGASQQKGASSCLSRSIAVPTSAVLFQDGALPVAAAFSFAAAGNGEGGEVQGTAHSWATPEASALLRHLGGEPGCSSRRSRCPGASWRQGLPCAMAAALVPCSTWQSLVGRAPPTSTAWKGGQCPVHSCHV